MFVHVDQCECLGKQVNGPARILEVVGWFVDNSHSKPSLGISEDEDSSCSGSDGWDNQVAEAAAAAASALPVCRVKNRFVKAKLLLE